MSNPYNRPNPVPLQRDPFQTPTAKRPADRYYKEAKPARRFSLWRVNTPQLDQHQRARFLSARAKARWTWLAILFVPLLIAGVWAGKYFSAYFDTRSGISAYQNEDFRQAEKKFESVLSQHISRQAAQQHYNHGTVMHMRGFFYKAVMDFEKAFTLAPEAEVEFRCLVMINLVHSTTGLAQDDAADGQDYAKQAEALRASGDPAATDDLGYTADELQDFADEAFEWAAQGFAEAQELVLIRRAVCDEADPPQSQQEQDERDQQQEEELEELERQQRESEQNQSDSQPQEPDGEGGGSEEDEEQQRQQELEDRNNQAQQNREDGEEREAGGDQPDGSGGGGQGDQQGGGGGQGDQQGGGGSDPGDQQGGGDGQGTEQDGDGEEDGNGGGGTGQDGDQGGSSRPTPKW